MPSSRRASVTTTHRRHAIKEEIETPRQYPTRQLPSHGAVHHSRASHHIMQPLPGDRLQAALHVVRQSPTAVANLPCFESADGKDASFRQLPSLRTLIDLPPLQTLNTEYTPRPHSPLSPLATTPKQSTHNGQSVHGQDAMSARHLHSMLYPDVHTSYVDDHYDGRKRPAPEASFRLTTRHGPPSTALEAASPGATPSNLALARHTSVYEDYQAHAVRSQSFIGSEYMAAAGGPFPHKSQQHPAFATEKSGSMGPANSLSHPRCVGQKDIAGKGLCYVYDDGSFCEAYVRGEPVNPEWGLTRAGRARKRLAKACNGCREKKVKCEPGTNSRCQRCSRKGQECQWSHYSETSPERDSYDGQAKAGNVYPRPSEPNYDQQYATSMPPTPPYTVSSKNSYEPIPSLGELEDLPFSKRIRSDSPERRLVPIVLEHDQYRAGLLEQTSISNHVLQKELSSAWEVDVYQTDSIQAKTLLHLYFEYRDTAINCVLPRESFWRWVRSATTRSHDEKVLLHAVLALGSLFSADASLKDSGARYASLACLAEKELTNQHSLPLALARLHLTFYCFATGNSAQSCYYIDSSFGTINALQLNVQEGILNIPDDPMRWDFGLNRVELIECRRRVFWLGYLTERHCSFRDSITLFRSIEEDIFLHLPNNERHYQTGVDSHGPYFEGGLLERNHGSTTSSSQHSNGYQLSTPSGPGASSDLGAMALSITIAHIWGDVQRHIYRSLHTSRPNNTSVSSQAMSFSPTASYAVRHDAFTSTTLRRLADWEFSLPGHLRYSQTSTWRNIRCGNSGDLSTYLALQCVHYATRLHLARFTRWRELPRDVVQRNIRVANSAARDLLAIVSALARSFEITYAPSLGPSFHLTPGVPTTVSTSSPTSVTVTPTASTNTAAQAPISPQPSAPTHPVAIDRAFAHPMIGHAILLAADTISSAGSLERHLRDTLRSLTDALAVLRCVGAFFATAAEQESLLRQRVELLAKFQNPQTSVGVPGSGRGSPITMSAPTAADASEAGIVAGRATWRCVEPCRLVHLPRDLDIVYGVDESVYAEAMAGPGGWPDVRL